jgi:hypothetical protein
MESTEQQIIETLATKVMEWRQVNLGLSIIWVDADGRDVSALVDSWDPLRSIADAWMIVQQMAKADPVTSHRFQEALSMYCIYDITPERICWAAWQSLNTPVT